MYLVSSPKGWLLAGSKQTRPCPAACPPAAAPLPHTCCCYRATLLVQVGELVTMPADPALQHGRGRRGGVCQRALRTSCPSPRMGPISSALRCAHPSRCPSLSLITPAVLALPLPFASDPRGPLCRGQRATGGSEAAHPKGARQWAGGGQAGGGQQARDTADADPSSSLLPDCRRRAAPRAPAPTMTTTARPGPLPESATRTRVSALVWHHALASRLPAEPHRHRALLDQASQPRHPPLTSTRLLHPPWRSLHGWHARRARQLRQGVRPVRPDLHWN